MEVDCVASRLDSDGLLRGVVGEGGILVLATGARLIMYLDQQLVRARVYFLGEAKAMIAPPSIVAAAVAIWLAMRKAAAMRADVAMTKNRRATKMAKARLKQAGDFLSKPQNASGMPIGYGGRGGVYVTCDIYDYDTIPDVVVTNGREDWPLCLRGSMLMA